MVSVCAKLKRRSPGRCKSTEASAISCGYNTNESAFVEYSRCSLLLLPLSTKLNVYYAVCCMDGAVNENSVMQSLCKKGNAENENFTFETSSLLILTTNQCSIQHNEHSNG